MATLKGDDAIRKQRQRAEAKRDIEDLLKNYAMAIIHMADQPNSVNDRDLKDAVRELAEHLSR